MNSVCQAGHALSTSAGRPSLLLNLLAHDIEATRSVCGPNANLADHLLHLIPHRSVEDRGRETIAIHTLPDPACPCADCDGVSVVSCIDTSWPEILHICPETIASTPNTFQQRPLPLLRQFNIQDVEYQLVGRIHREGSVDLGHFTCDQLIGDRLYQSDGMLLEGAFADVGDVGILDRPDFTVQLLVYHRLSECKVSHPRLYIK